MTNQIASRIQVGGGKKTIWAKQRMTPAIGNRGTSGALNRRGKSGRVLRNTMTLMQTITKASKVPIDTNSLSTPMGKRPARVAERIPVTAVVICGVRNLE